MNFEEAARRVHLGRSILFTGAGFSFGAKSIANKGLMDATTLATELSERVNEAPLPLDIATDQFLEKFGSATLVEELQSLFIVREIKDYHLILSRLPWKRVYTTNYDNLFETCRRMDGVAPRSLTLSDPPERTLDQGVIVHFNGYAERLSPAYWDPDIILTTTDYLTDKVHRSPWSEVFRSDLSMSDAIFFLGYSLYDIDIGRLLFENPDIIQKTFFVVGRNAERATVLKAGRLGTVLSRNVVDIVSSFPEAGSSEAPSAAPFPVTFQRTQFQPSTARPTADDVISFLTKGDLNESLLAKSILDGKSDYYIARQDLASLAHSVIGGNRRALIHSDLGNGKTLAAIELGVILSVAGFDFYSFIGSTEGIDNDFHYFQSLPVEIRSKSAILIEDALSFSDTARAMAINFPELTIICTARTAALETRLQSASDALGDNYLQFELNELSTDEASELSQLLLSQGLWGEKQGWRDDRRLGFIKNNCSSHLSSVLLSVCKSSLVIGRLGELIKEISSYKDTTYESLLVVLLMAYAGKSVSISQVCEIVQADLFKTGKAHNSEILKEFVHFGNNRVAVRSPVFAQAVLAEIIPDHVKVEKIPDIVFRLEQLSGHNDFYKAPSRRLMRFGAIERILSSQDKSAKLVSFYENLRATGVVNQNPQFWLQYAIARMSFKDYAGAETNFNAAFGLVKGRAYDPYQIENQFARFLLESRTETTLWIDYYEAFEKAHQIVKAQMIRVNDGDYPYNVAGKYLPFVEARHTELDQDQLDRLVECCDELIDLAAEAPSDIKRRGYWRNFMNAMRAVKDIVQEVR